MPTSDSSPEKTMPPASGAPELVAPLLDLPAPPEGARVVPAAAGPRGTAGRVTKVAGISVIALLCAICLGLAFRSGAYRPLDWLPFLIGSAALAAVVALSGPAVLSGRFQKILLGLFGAQAVWTAVSLLWATSVANAWEETNRTLFYAAAIALVFLAVRWAGSMGLQALAILVTGAVEVMALVVVIRLGISDDPSHYFVGGRLRYPIGYYNGLASLLMISFWLALGIANGVGRSPHGADRPSSDTHRLRDSLPRWTQPLFLVLSVFFAELALLPQSRGAFWTFFLVVPFFIILSANRFRAPHSSLGGRPPAPETIVWPGFSLADFTPPAITPEPALALPYKVTLS